ncbi:hypothetical protein EV580_1307 [Mycobacterium sp. BK086]|uniref:hypothetical protein n=1 Tax=Mycobacterium sp. BK086 TaxID=2512165 RepID=UPI001060C918|nr:hypothetical protein [Mycobacterium sp. BK086]TDO18125.1 hypothetical protein EV580_1307 [Mycobacterium sp. BK086]
MPGTAGGTIALAGSAVGRRERLAAAGGSVSWTGSAMGSSPKAGHASARIRWNLVRAVGDDGVVWPDDRWRIHVQEIVSGDIVGPDMTFTNLIVQRALSGPCDIQFDVNPNDAQGIYFKPWGHLIHLEKAMQGKRRIWATGIVQPSTIDEKTGVLHLKAKGFACYPKGIPWLEDLNWIANDAFEAPVEIWRHLQEDFPNGDLGVEVFPKTSGIEMLPGYNYTGAAMSINFFATFVRAVDKLDCGDYIDALARTIPFDYAERSAWNGDRTDITKKIELGYPRLGVIQDHLAFIFNENVTSGKPHIETQIDWVSDIGIQGFYPGFEYSSELSNADPDRVRRYLNEIDANLDSNERTAAWAHRLLARRQTPAYWESITVDPHHDNAPFGTYDVGDTITVSGEMPWVGEISQDHKIIAITVDDVKNTYTLTLKADGEFNYDPIFFPNGSSTINANSGFDFNLNNWTASGPGWSHDAGQGHNALGCATITADGTDHDLLSDPFGVSHFQIFPLTAWVKCFDAVASSDSAIQLVAQFYDDDLTPTHAIEIATPKGLRGLVAWQQLTGNVLTPAGSTKVALRLHVGAGMTAGRVCFDDAEIKL